MSTQIAAVVSVGIFSLSLVVISWLSRRSVITHSDVEDLKKATALNSQALSVILQQLGENNGKVD